MQPKFVQRDVGGETYTTIMEAYILVWTWSKTTS